MISVNEHQRRSDYYEGDFSDQKLKDGYFTSSTKMDGFEEADQFKIPGEMRGAGKDGMSRDDDRTLYIYKKDEMPEAPKAPEASVEPTPAEAPAAKPTSTPQTSEQLKQAQDLVNSYTSDIMNNNSSVYNPPSDIPQSSTSATAAKSFLKSKKLDLGSGLSLK